LETSCQAFLWSPQDILLLSLLSGLLVILKLVVATTLTVSYYDLDFVLSKRHTLIWSNTRELDRELHIETSTLYTKLQWSMPLLFLAYPKDHVFALRPTCILHIIMTLFTQNLLCCSIMSCDHVTYVTLSCDLWQCHTLSSSSYNQQ